MKRSSVAGRHPASRPGHHCGGLESPQDGEYSRVTDPERYDVVFARARVWTEVLAGLLAADTSTVDPRTVDDREQGCERVARLDRPPTARGAHPLRFLEHEGRARDGLVASVEVAVGRSSVRLGRLPDCGCDACDDGSASLLEALDDLVVDAIDPLVLLRGDGWHVDRGTNRRGYGHGTRRPKDLTRLVDAAFTGTDVAFPADATAVVSRGWRAEA